LTFAFNNSLQEFDTFENYLKTCFFKNKEDNILNIKDTGIPMFVHQENIEYFIVNQNSEGE
jgi:hypothetical protein